MSLNSAVIPDNEIFCCVFKLDKASHEIVAWNIPVSVKTGEPGSNSIINQGKFFPIGTDEC